MTRDDEIKNQEKLEKKLLHFMKGNRFAVQFIIQFIYVCHLWDDLIDKDNPRTDNEISDAFRICLVDLPLNPFYAHNMHLLTPVIINGILEWEDANKLEKGNLHEQHMAYMLRAGLMSQISFCAYICGGKDWAREIGPEIRNLYEEPLEQFLEEMRCLIQLQP